ncbi:MAG: M23 family metallopeptidase [Clostridiales bacterium]|nr:M23 family metallopeptidase [Clostridiales bacterium]
MKEYYHLINTHKKRLSFLIIPSTTNKILKFSIPYWIPAIASLLVILTLSCTYIFSYMFFDTAADLALAELQINKLELENEVQYEEIAFLNNRTREINTKLQNLNLLQDKVKNMVGLDENNKKELVSCLVTRSDVRSSLFGSNYQDDFDSLNSLIESQTISMQQLIVDVEEQLKYLDARPDFFPTKGRLSSPFGYRISPFSRRREFHHGIDIANSTNTPIYAAGSGIVTFSGYQSSYGRVIIISHGFGYTSVYAHNRSNLVAVGDHVKKGDMIAKMGSTGRSTGPHLHFEIRINGDTVDPKTILAE